MMDWSDRYNARDMRGTLQTVQDRLHDAIYFGKPLTDEKIKELARDVERTLRVNWP